MRRKTDTRALVVGGWRLEEVLVAKFAQRQGEEEASNCALVSADDI